MNQQLINALACALASLRGTAGGYSPVEKAEAVVELEKLMAEEVKK